ncbi:unnamed protein product, partial [Prorocentrum cordatum]
VVDVDVAGCAEKLTLLEGGMSAKDDDSMFAEMTTWVPNCSKWYRKLPCTCSHVMFEDVHGEFLPGFGKLWHLPTLQRLLTEQRRFWQDLSGTAEPTAENAFWRNTALAGFKNSLDVSFFVFTTHSNQFWDACQKVPECRLSAAFTVIVGELFSLKALSMGAKAGITKDYEKHLALFETDRPSFPEAFLRAPWSLLLTRPSWAAAFAWSVGELDHLLSMSTDRARPLLSTWDSTSRTAEGVEGCAASVGGAEGAADSGESCAAQDPIVVAALSAAFDEHRHHPLERIVAFGRALSSSLPESAPAEAWPSVEEHAEPLSGSWLYRFCGPPGTIVHRSVGSTQLHFLAADVVELGGELLLELLWFASSDDRCVMVGTGEEGAHGGKTYYSWAHTLPMAHLVHWRCDVAWAGAEPGGPGPDAVTVSYSGFASATACRLPGARPRLRRGGPARAADAPGRRWRLGAEQRSAVRKRGPPHLRGARAPEAPAGLGLQRAAARHGAHARDRPSLDRGLCFFFLASSSASIISPSSTRTAPWSRSWRASSSRGR